jgi:type II secretory pathway component GspD/PulD (secretin)
MRARILVGALLSAAVTVPVAAQQPSPIPPLPRLISAIVEGTPVEMQLRWPIARTVAVRDSLDASTHRLVLTVTGMRADADVRRMVRRGNIAALRVAPRGDSALVAIIELTDVTPYRLTRTATEVVFRFAGVGEQVSPQTITLEPDVRVATVTDSASKAKGPGGRSAGALDLTADDAFGTADQRTRERLKAWEVVTSERVTASWDRTPLRDVLALIGRMTGRSVAPGTGIDSIAVSGDYREARWTDVLVSIARIYGLRLRVGAGDILTVESATALVKADESIPLETRVIQLGYAKVAEVVPVLEKNASKRGSAIGLTENRAVIITDIPDNLERAIQLVRLLDRPDQSVRISYMVVSVDRTIARDLGVILDAADARTPGNALGGIPLPVPQQTGSTGSATLTGPMSGDPRYINLVRDRVSSAMSSPLPSPLSPTFKFLASTLAGNYSIVGLIQALETNSMARVVARQQGVVRQGREFKGSSAEETPLRVQAFTGTGASNGSGSGGSSGTGAVGSAGGSSGSSGGGGAGGIPFNSVGLVSTGIKLNATPTIEPDSMVALDIRVERSTAVPSGLGDAGVQFLRNEYSTSLRARSGETIVLGGLRDRVEGEQTAGVPFLMKIPLIGKLFSSKSRSGTERELLILVTAVIE